MPDGYARALEEVVAASIEPAAVAVDTEGRFPSGNIDALRDAGLLGLISATEVGGTGLGLRAATDVVGRIAGSCTSTAMIVCMHYAATAVLEELGPESVRRDIAAGRHLTTLAFSESGSRSHFWAPLSTADADGDEIILDASKSWVTAATAADSFVWSSRPVGAEGASTIWLVPASTQGIKVDAPFDGLGLRGNDSSPVSAVGARIPADHRLGDDGGGFDIMIGTVLPWFSLMSASISVGVMAAAIDRTASHLSATRLEHLDESLANNPVNRLRLARSKVTTDQVAMLVDDAVRAVEGDRDDATLRVLEAKAAAGDAAIEVTDACMRLCGGAAFRKEVGVERLFRDSRAAAVMAPTSDVLYDFIGKALCGLPLF
ncbi:MAG: acyl-CoA/acyl-ACP dehydrogenase [Actinobacteria bacterium]|nr:acyl-CoA/acyl-ACP dehydrogenase [Actinomycetota bacterium]